MGWAGCSGRRDRHRGPAPGLPGSAPGLLFVLLTGWRSRSLPHSGGLNTDEVGGAARLSTSRSTGKQQRAVPVPGQPRYTTFALPPHCSAGHRHLWPPSSGAASERYLIFAIREEPEAVACEALGVNKPPLPKRCFFAMVVFPRSSQGWGEGSTHSTSSRYSPTRCSASRLSVEIS